MGKTTLIIGLLCYVLSVNAQTDTSSSKFTFTGDFRFRVEQDWDSKKTDGTFRDNRSRLRYRVRLGGSYNINQWATIGARIRTGQPDKQQDPQLTLGDGYGEFNTLPIGFEKVFFEAKHKGFLIWAGKNTFPFEKSNELFWSDNVYPEGFFLKKRFIIKSKFVNQLDLSGGHFIINTSGNSFENDSYFEGFQASFSLFDSKLKVYPSFYYFKNIPNIPDGNADFVFNYSILHLGTKLKLLSKPNVNFEADYYSNLENYDSNDNIESNFKNQKNGFVIGITFGQLKTQGDWLFKVTYTNLEQYAAVDFFAQNDWARWDYSSFDSPDGRLTNFKGIELVGGYALNQKMTLKMKWYFVDQLVPYGAFKETGSRARIDLDIKL
ncbi:Putative porin [Flaviramulus basaltis]|uniref:Putative porin n=1 Tax=Flaviramulus basaltis TaxID=369401 RepID=A0A1K2IAN7_9FLAO|nr:putative porin [Flaviramulus basaltis]SFZ89368.1 Putative porin [Flaviramulus basaltis]